MQALMLNEILPKFCAHEAKLTTSKYLSEGVAVKIDPTNWYRKNVNFVNIFLMLQLSIIIINWC